MLYLGPGPATVSPRHGHCPSHELVALGPGRLQLAMGPVCRQTGTRSRPSLTKSCARTLHVHMQLQQR